MKNRLLVSYLSITFFVLLVLEIPLGVSYANFRFPRLRPLLDGEPIVVVRDGPDVAGVAPFVVQSPERSEYGLSVAPGDYATVVINGLHMACFEAPADTRAPIVVFGNWGSTTHVDAQPL